MNVLILCGGKSSRMNGLDKANLPYLDHTFLEIIAMEFQECIHKYISNNQTVMHQYPGYKNIVDEYDSIGPMAGITSFFHQTNIDDVFVCACDMPYISKLVMEKLYSLYKGEDALYVYDDNYDYPLCCIYSRNILPVFESQIQKQRYSLMKAIQKSNFKKIHIDILNVDVHHLRNINTLKDYEGM